MKKETIMDTYAIKQGYDSQRELVMDHVFDSDGVLNYEDLIDHQNAVTDLIQDELKKKKIHIEYVENNNKDWYDYTNQNKSVLILNTENIK